jgi:hypothetical protein
MYRRWLPILMALVLVSHGDCASSHPDFSGTWRQSNERSTPARAGEVILRIDHRDPELTVETVISGSRPRRATQHYTADGRISTSTGADGDEFHTSIAWKGQSLVFSIEEHEDGRILRSQETWTLIENGTALKRLRERSESQDRGGKQTIIYLRKLGP